MFTENQKHALTRSALLLAIVCISGTLAQASPLGDFFTKAAAEITSVWALALSLAAVLYAGGKLAFSDHGRGAAVAILLGVVVMQTAARFVVWLQ
jgi:type IV secretory pathway VirB2 component (pilin)